MSRGQSAAATCTARQRNSRQHLPTQNPARVLCSRRPVNWLVLRTAPRYQSVNVDGTRRKQGLRFTLFTDGTSNTLLAAEAAEAVPWTSPRDLAYQSGEALPRLGGHPPGGFNALLADFNVHWIKQTISDKTLRDAITRNDGRPLGPDW